MEVRFGALSRGSGKVYIHLDVIGLPEEHDVTAIAQTAEGLPVPARVVWSQAAGAYVLVLSSLSVTQVAHVLVKDAQGDVLGSFETQVKARNANLTSKINTVTRNAEALSVRNADQHLRTLSMNLTADKLVQDVDGTDVQRLNIVVYAQDKQALVGDIVVRTLGRSGQTIALGEPIVLDDSISVHPNVPGLFVRTMDVSVRIPSSTAYVTYWAAYADDHMPGAFESLEAWMLGKARSDWASLRLPSEQDPIYEEWFLSTHQTPPRELAAQRSEVIEGAPSFSVIVPLYHTPLDFFREMADSVLAQTYANYELILVNSTPEDVELAQEIERYADAEERVRVVMLERNLGITENTNAGVDVAQGDFLCFFDHDDTLEPDILYHYAKAIAARPDIDLIYCDEDKLHDGHYSGPFFKPDWSPDLLLAFNYVTHLLCVRSSIVAASPRPDKTYDGAQDYRLTWVVAEQARSIYHVRKVLYHWRIHEGSTAAGAGAKPYTVEVGRRVVQEHLDRIGVRATVDPDPDIDNHYRVRYHFDSEPLVSVVIPNKDMTDILERCLASIDEKTTYQNYEVVVVENNSTDTATFAYYKELPSRYPKVRVVEQPPTGEFNFSHTVNYGFDAARGDYLLMLNNDTEVIAPTWIEAMLGLCQRPDVGAVGAKLLYPDGLVQHAGVYMPRSGPGHVSLLMPSRSHDYYDYINVTRDLSVVTGACLLTKRSVYEKVGKLDEVLKVNYNDVDFCLKIRELGLLVAYAPDATLYHYESVSRGVDASLKKRLAFRRAKGILEQRWPMYYEDGDPFTSPSFGEGNCYHQIDFLRETPV